METIGYLAGTITSLSLLPQILRTLRSKSSRDISWGWLIAMLTGMLLWLAYGWSIANYPMIVFNLIGFFSFAILSVAKCVFDKKH
jgi:MtN3 and saliva related transmembrane protein